MSIRAGEREPLLDVLRGITLLGILLVNFPGIPTTSRVDSIASLIVGATVYRTSYAVFPFLFGVGVALQSRRWRVGWRHVLLARRLSWLFVIGSAHMILIWGGDILVAYAIVGFVLLPLQNLPTRWVRRLVFALALVLVLQPRAVEMIGAGIDARRNLDRSAILAEEARRDRFLTRSRSLSAAIPVKSPSYAHQILDRWNSYSTRIARMTDVRYLLGGGGGDFGGVGYYALLGRDLIFLFVLGFLAGRQSWLSVQVRSPRTWPLVTMVGVMATAGGTIYQVLDVPHQFELDRIAMLLGTYGKIALLVGICGYLLRNGMTEYMAGFGAVGRMSLSNYLLQSVMLSGALIPLLPGTVLLSTGGALAVNVLFFRYFQIPFSVWWLGRQRAGPMEMLWRRLTYGSLLREHRESVKLSSSRRFSRC